MRNDHSVNTDEDICLALKYGKFVFQSELHALNYFYVKDSLQDDLYIRGIETQRDHETLTTTVKLKCNREILFYIKHSHKVIGRRGIYVFNHLDFEFGALHHQLPDPNLTTFNRLAANNVIDHLFKQLDL